MADDSPIEALINFQEWLDKSSSADGTTTTVQQMEFARSLYEKSCDVTTLQRQPTQYDPEVTMHGSSIEDFVRWKGIRVDWLLDHFFQLPFFKTLLDFSCPMWFVRKVCMTEILRQHSVSSGAVVDHIVGALSGDQRDVSESASVFVSYTGRHSLVGFQQILEQLRGEYIWIDIFCVDQFAWNRRKDDGTVAAFANMLMDRLNQNIAKIGRTVLIIERWDDIKYTLNQIWVLWEVFSTVEGETGFDILLTKDETQRYHDELLDGTENFMNTMDILSNIHSLSALTTNQIEQNEVKSRMQSVEGGIHNVDATVAKKTREWLINSARRYLESLEQSRAGWDMSICMGYSNFSTLLWRHGLIDEAGRIGELVFRFAFSNNGANAETINSLVNLGQYLTDAGSLDKAEECLVACLDYESLLEREDFVILQNALAIVYKKQARVVEAEALHRKNLELLENEDESNKYTLLNWNNLGVVLKEQGRYHEAEAIYRKVLETRKRLLIDDHLSIASVTSNLAIVLRNQGKFDEAEPLYRYVLKHSQRIHGDDHPFTHVAMMNLGTALLEQRKFDESELFYGQALHEQEKMFGRKSIAAIDTLHNMARLMGDMGNFSKAEELYCEVLKFRKVTLGDEHLLTLSSMNNLGTLLYDTSRFQEAEPLFQSVLATRRRLLGNLHPHTLNTIKNLSLVLEQCGRVSEAEELKLERSRSMNAAI